MATGTYSATNTRRDPTYGTLPAALLRSPRVVRVPLALLLTKDLTPAAKFLWIRLRFDEMHPRRRSLRPDRLAKRTGLGRSTVYVVLKIAANAGWLRVSIDPKTGKKVWKTALPESSDRRTVDIPANLIRASHQVRPQEILCYGYLQTLPGFKRMAGEFKWAQVRQLSGLDLRTIKRAVRRLAELYWISMTPRKRIEPIFYRLQDADQAYQEEAERRVDQATTLKSVSIGEAYMREYLSLIVDTRGSEDGARPEFLVNPYTGERLELDRYYPVHKVAFEFNGRQHYQASKKYSRKQVEAQKRRDAVKRRICKEQGITLVVIHEQDLSLHGMIQKVGTLLPRRSLRGFRATIKRLDAQCSYYRKKATMSDRNATNDAGRNFKD